MESEQPSSDRFDQAGHQDENSGASSENNRENKSEKTRPERKKRSSRSSALLHICKDLAKLYDAISNHDELSSNQRALVRSLVGKQSAALDRKLNGLPAEAGEDFESLSKVLRKENNRLDSLLEGKETMFKQFHETYGAAEQALISMQQSIKSQEDES